MSDQTRRKFTQSILGIIISGFIPGLSSVICSCKRDGQSKISAKEKEQQMSVANVKFEPAYIKLHKSGELKKRGEQMWQIMESCKLCPRECEVNRLQGEEGFCEASAKLEVYSAHPHFGEESPLVGSGGSGTIFFTNCGLRCVFCINYEISQEGEGQVRSLEELAGMMLFLQNGPIFA